MDGLKPLFKTWRENSLRENKSQEVKKKKQTTIQKMTV